MKRLNRHNSALFLDRYRFIEQSNATETSGASFEYLTALETKYKPEHIQKSLENSLTQILAGVDSFEAAEEDFYEKQEAVDALEGSASRLTKSTQPKLGDRMGYRRARRKELRSREKDEKNYAKTLKRAEKDMGKTFEQESIRKKERGFVANMESLDADIAQLKARYQELESQVLVTKDSKNRFREVQREILINAQTGKEGDGVTEMLKYLGVSSDIDSRQKTVLQELSMVKKTLETLQSIRNNPKFDKALLLAKSGDNLPLRARMAGYKALSEVVEVDTKKNEETKKTDESKAEIKKESAYVEIETKQAAINTKKDEIKKIEQELKVLRAKPYQTEKVLADIAQKETQKTTAEQALVTLESELKQATNDVLSKYIIRAAETEVVVIRNADAFTPLIKDHINTIQDEINAGTNVAANQTKLKDLENVLQNIERKSSIGSSDEVKKLFAGSAIANDINSFVDQYVRSLDEHVAAERDVLAAKELLSENNFEFDRAMTYESAMNQEKINMEAAAAKEQVSASLKREQDQLKAKIEAEKAGRTFNDKIESSYLKAFKEGTAANADSGYEAAQALKTDLANTNAAINYLLEEIRELDQIVKGQGNNDGVPSPESVNLKEKRESLNDKIRHRNELLAKRAEIKQLLIKDRDTILNELTAKLRTAKEARNTASLAKNETAMKTAQVMIDQLNQEYRTAARMMNEAINEALDISYLQAANEKTYNAYLNQVGSGNNFVSYSEYVSKNGSSGGSEVVSGVVGGVSRRAGAGQRESLTKKQYERALKDVPRYQAEFTAEEVVGLKAKTDAFLESLEPTTRNQVAQLLNLGLVQAVTYSKKVPDASGNLVRKQFDEFVIKVQPRDERTGEVKSDVYYTIKHDGQLIWKSSVDLGGGIVRSLKPGIGESYNFKAKYQNPQEFIQKTLSRLPDHMKHHDHIMKLVDEDLGQLSDDFVYDYSTADGNMYLEAKIYNRREDETFIAKFKLDEKGRWVIEKNEFENLDPTEQAVLEEFGIRGGKRMSRAYFTRRAREMARQDQDETEEISVVRKFFRNVGKRVRRGWEWIKGVFGY